MIFFVIQVSHMQVPQHKEWEVLLLENIVLHIIYEGMEQ
jgi:hypothetical protein